LAVCAYEAGPFETRCEPQSIEIPDVALNEPDARHGIGGFFAWIGRVFLSFLQWIMNLIHGGR
jgi:hypothetical protein